MKNKNLLWLTDIDTAIEVYELAKKENISLQKAFDKVLKARDDKIKFIGSIDKDGDMLTGDLREDGLKIININEEIKKKK